MNERKGIMMKIFKKIISTILASVMCIPSGIMSMAYAAETDTLGGYTVTLTDTENGVMQFSEECMESSTATQDSYHMLTVNEEGEFEETENDGSVWAFNQGDTVEIELIPDADYEVSSLSIKNANTGKEMAHEDTSDNVFSFVMPAKSVTVEAVFAESQMDDGDNSDKSDADDNSNADNAGNVHDEPVNEENNIVEENEYGETVYKRIILTDDEAVSLQERIDSLPTAADLYSSLQGGEDVSDIEAEVDELNEIYFNELTDNERAQIDSSLLFSSLLTLKAGDFTPTEEETPSDGKLEELQERIDALDNVRDISKAEETDENYVVYDYGSDESGMLISNEEQDELFLEVMDLSQEVFLLDGEDQARLDTENLEEMYRFFTGGNPEITADDGIMTMSLDDGIMLLAEEAGDPYMQGWYGRSKVSQKYNAAYYSGMLENGQRMITLYCGDASKPVSLLFMQESFP